MSSSLPSSSRNQKSQKGQLSSKRRTAEHLSNVRITISNDRVRTRTCSHEFCGLFMATQYPHIIIVDFGISGDIIWCLNIVWSRQWEILTTLIVIAHLHWALHWKHVTVWGIVSELMFSRNLWQLIALEGLKASKRVWGSYFSLNPLPLSWYHCPPYWHFWRLFPTTLRS